MSDSKISIPPKDRAEWLEMVRGKFENQYSNFVLQMKLTQASKDLKQSSKSEQEVIDEIYSLCEKYALAVQKDFQQIFKTW